MNPLHFEPFEMYDMDTDKEINEPNDIDYPEEPIPDSKEDLFNIFIMDYHSSLT